MRGTRKKRSCSSLLREWYEYIAAMPCFRCREHPVEVAHIELLVSVKTGLELPRRNGINTWAVIALCPGCHRHRQDSIHAIGEAKFFEAMDMDHGAVARVWGGWLVDFLEGRLK